MWSRSESRLLFSDVRGNTIYEWTEADGARAFIDPVFEGDRTGLRSVSSNGLTLDTDGRLIMCEHGNRRISRVEADGTRTTLVDAYEGRRLNSPNDATYASDGWLYFTDPGSALEGRDESPLRELDFNGIYRLSPEGELELLYQDQSRPNGIALSSGRIDAVCRQALTGARRFGWRMTWTRAACPTGPCLLRRHGRGRRGGARRDEGRCVGPPLCHRPWRGLGARIPTETHLGTIRPDEVPNDTWRLGDDGRTHLR